MVASERLRAAAQREGRDMPSEVAKVFEKLPTMFQKGSVKKARTYYFSLDEDEKWTVSVTPDGCSVAKGKPAADADCFFKASKQMFLDVWSGKYTPSAKDFLMGSIKSNNPLLLKEFVSAFKK
jgi:putative sterol carrier protein